MAVEQGTKCSLFGRLLLFLLVLIINKPCVTGYRAVVVAYKPSVEAVPSETVNRNKQRYQDIILNMGEEADIIVFPEHGLTSLKPTTLRKIELELYSVYVPQVPAQSFSSGILSGLSSAAKSSGTYVVCNVLEKYHVTNTELRYYSTNVVFNTAGELIAKCRKQNLYFEKSYDTEHEGVPFKKDTPRCTFKASFRNGVSRRFALLFDSHLFAEVPKDVDDVIVTSSLPNELPFTFGVSLHVGYSVRNRLNLLVSAYTNSSGSNGGTGIYFKNGTSRITLGSEPYLKEDLSYELNESVTTKVIDARVTGPMKPDTVRGVPYRNITLLDTTNTTAEHVFVDNNARCSMHMDGVDTEVYKWVILNATKHLMGQYTHFMICSLVKPIESLTKRRTVNNVTVVASQRKSNVIQILPLSLGHRPDSTIMPINFQYEETDNDGVITTKMVLTKQSDLLIFGVLFIVKSPVSQTTSIHIFSHMFAVVSLPLFGILWSKGDF